MREQALLRDPQIRTYVGRPVTLDLQRAKDYVQPFREPSLDRADLSRVPGELQHGGGLRRSRGFVSYGS